MENIPSFVTHRAPEIDSAWSSAVEKHDKPQATTEVSNQTNKFKHFIHTYLHQSTDIELKKFDIDRKFQWEDVKREFDGAIEGYNKQKSRLHLRKLGRSFSNNASNIEVLLTFIPEGDYTSILCGALTLVFNAAKRMKAIRERILSYLSGLSELVKGTECYHQIYHEDLELWSRAQELYVGILEGVESMTEWLDSNAYKKALKALFRQNGYGNSIEDKIRKGIEDKVVAFRERFECCLHLRIRTLGNGIGTLTKVLEGIVDHGEWLKVVQGQFNDLRSDIRQMQRASRSPTPQPLFMFGLSPQISQPFVDAYQLLDVLQINPSTPPQDIESALYTGQAMPPGQQARTAALMQHLQFQAWLKSGQSLSLVVNGMDTQADETLSSPMTYCTALLSHTFKRMNVAVPLTHLCGQHTSPDDPLEGAQGLLRALICQVIVAYEHNLDLSFINYTFLKSIKAQDIGALCELFRGLLVSITQSVIFCIVDGISWFETRAKIRELQVTMLFLRDLTNEIEIFGGDLTFKFLITSAGESQYASEWFPPSSILSLDEQLEHDGYGYDNLQMADISRDAVSL